MARVNPNRINFTDRAIARLKPLPQGQEQVTDSGCKGLSVIVGVKTKTFKAQYQLHGLTKAIKLAEFGEYDMASVVDGGRMVDVDWARERCIQLRSFAKHGIDP